MKKLYFILFILISSFLSYGQKNFDNGDADGDGVKDNNRGSAGDNLWSNADNWANGKPSNNAGNNAKVVIKSPTVIIDQAIYVGEITKANHTINGSQFDTEITATGNGHLYFTGKGQNNSNVSIINKALGKDLKFNLPVTFQKFSTNTHEQIRIFTNSAASVTFAANQTVTLLNNLRIITSMSSTNTARVNFNGAVTGSKPI